MGKINLILLLVVTLGTALSNALTDIMDPPPLGAGFDPSLSPTCTKSCADYKALGYCKTSWSGCNPAYPGKTIEYFCAKTCYVAPVDPCANVNCLNGGVCNNGVCTCPAGCSGTFCESCAAPPEAIRWMTCSASSEWSGAHVCKNALDTSPNPWASLDWGGPLEEPHAWIQLDFHGMYDVTSLEFTHRIGNQLQLFKDLTFEFSNGEIAGPFTLNEEAGGVNTFTLPNTIHASSVNITAISSYKRYHNGFANIKVFGSSEKPCSDTPNWTDGNGSGNGQMDCVDYETYCAYGGAKKSWVGGAWDGERFNYPEKNCCVCGKIDYADFFIRIDDLIL